MRRSMFPWPPIKSPVERFTLGRFWRFAGGKKGERWCPDVPSSDTEAGYVLHIGQVESKGDLKVGDKVSIKALPHGQRITSFLSFW